jgi:hypothetical protein
MTLRLPGFAGMRFFEALKLGGRTLTGYDLEAFQAHGIVRAVFVAAAREARLKGVAHRISA